MCCILVGMVGGKNAALESGSEFSMQQEDFPALPGSAPGNYAQSVVYYKHYMASYPIGQIYWEDIL